MTHLHKHISLFCQPLRRLRPRPYRKPFLISLALAGLALTCVSCSETREPTPPPPMPVTDTQPVGEGLKVIGFAVLGAAVVGVLGRMLK